MKKFVVFFLALLTALCCSCTADTSGNTYELTSPRWEADLEGGAKLNLEFKDNSALLKIDNNGENTQIKGRYIADEKSFVIFMPEIFQNYTFEYTPKGETLELSYNGKKIILNMK